MATQQLLKDIVSELLEDMVPKLLLGLVPEMLEKIVPQVPQPMERELLRDEVSKVLQEMVPGMLKDMVASEMRNHHKQYDDDDVYLAPTKDGAMVRGPKFVSEDLERYETNGYHPIHLGDVLGPNDEYTVVHKLGWGGFGTVWLCRDGVRQKWVAVKIMTANAIYGEMSDSVDARLMELDPSAPGAEFIAIPTHHFSVQGPNGTHQCIVLPFLGPRVWPNVWTRFSDPHPVLRALCKQATKAMQFLHGNNICHGDFRPHNTLLKIKSMDHLDDRQLLTILGEPVIKEIRMEPGLERPNSVPEYLVDPVDLNYALPDEFLMEEICVVDFGEAFPIDPIPKDLQLGIPLGYVPPEILVADDEGAPVIAPASDIWALGCTLYEIRTQSQFLEDSYRYDHYLDNLVHILGKLPQDQWERWRYRELYFDEEGKPVIEVPDRLDGPGLGRSVESLLKRSIGAVTVTTRPSIFMDEEEQKTFADLLRKVLEYDPAKRLTAEKILEHEWFKL